MSLHQIPRDSASMGPLVYTSGRLLVVPGSGVHVEASMGPLVYTSGRWARRPSPSPRRPRLQWGRWFTPAVGRPGGLNSKRFMRLQWGRWFTPAVGWVPWLYGRPRRVASMGPLVYTSGRHEAFVGGNQTATLQWGRWFTPAVGRGTCAGCRTAARASMGPLVYTSGRCRGAPDRSPRRTRFNGAAGLHQR